MDKVSKVVEKWADSHGYSITHRPNYKPNLIVVGERHGIWGYGKYPPFMEAQLDLVNECKPKRVAIEAPNVEIPDFYPLKTDFEELSGLMDEDPHRYFMKSTLADLHAWVSKLDYNGHLNDNSVRQKVAQFVLHWPENLYKKAASEVKADFICLEDKDIHEMQISHLKDEGGLGSLGLFVAHFRSLFMAVGLGKMQKSEGLTLAVMGSGHAEHMIDPDDDKHYSKYMDKERMYVVDQGEFDPKLKHDNGYEIGDCLLESLADILQVEKDFE